MENALFSCKGCDVVIEKAVSSKSGKEYVRLVLTLNGSKYTILDSVIINNILVNNLLKK